MKTDNPELDELARRIRQRTRSDTPVSSPGPLVLFLGERCARAAGAPTPVEIAREALRMFGFETSPSSEPISDQEALDRFASQTGHLSGSQIARMLRSLYANVPVPSFYQELARLVREHYFPLILTTNYDNLLEQALTAAGVRNSEFRVTTFASRWRASSGPSEFPDQEPLTHLVKLHGDLAQNTVYISPQEIESALRSSKHWIKAELRGDLVMIGHSVSDDPINDWLAHSKDRQLWWIDPEPPADPARIQAWTTEYHQITGEIARPQVFFTQFSLRLLHEAEEVAAAVEPGDHPLSLEALGSIAKSEPAPLSEILQREVRRNQSVLYNLEQEAIPGERPAQVQAQIAYQKRQLSKLEEKIRSLPEIKPLVLEIVRKIGTDILHAHDDPQTNFPLENLAQYVQVQIATIEREFEKDAPNQFLVSASLGATLTLADRLVTEFGSQVVDPDSVKQLAVLLPTAATKVIL